MKYIILAISLMFVGCGHVSDPPVCKEYCEDLGYVSSISMSGYCRCVDRYMAELSPSVCVDLCTEAGYVNGTYNDESCNCEKE